MNLDDWQHLMDESEHQRRHAEELAAMKRAAMIWLVAAVVAGLAMIAWVEW